MLGSGSGGGLLGNILGEAGRALGGNQGVARYSEFILKATMNGAKPDGQIDEWEIRRIVG